MVEANEVELSIGRHSQDCISDLILCFVFKHSDRKAIQHLLTLGLSFETHHIAEVEAVEAGVGSQGNHVCKEVGQTEEGPIIVIFARNAY